MLHFVDTKNVIGGFMCNLEEQSQESVILELFHVRNKDTSCILSPDHMDSIIRQRARKLYLPLHSSSMDALVKVFGGLSMIYGDNTENGFIFKHLTACMSGRPK